MGKDNQRKWVVFNVLCLKYSNFLDLRYSCDISLCGSQVFVLILVYKYNTMFSHVKSGIGLSAWEKRDNALLPHLLRAF